ncbi:hypothetical protein PHET_05807 [Paragonimus heterotremus]|uniref:Uncharacterized protein n=1 Tax=Paragonimus heterotremus TaxID=100268 RepID=A0A8J4WRC8_9TREM|nr:hypothetical protein PHET_05807 [Paragonimus heterotremus]
MESVDSKAVMHLTRSWSVERLPEVSRLVLTKCNPGATLEIISFRIGQPSELALIEPDVPETNWVIKQRTGKWNEPYAVRTILGWTLMGPISHRKNFAFDVHTIQLQDVQDDIERLCHMELVDSTSGEERGMSIEDYKALTKLEHSIILKDGHYEISLLWHTDPLLLFDNRSVVLQRLQTLHTRFQKSGNVGELFYRCLRLC